ncbi:MAG: hypothetical protein ACLQU2_29030 [Candidatus Binataceae bacterium]
MTEQQTNRAELLSFMDDWPTSTQDWQFISEGLRAAQATAIVSAADQGISIKRVLRRMTGSSQPFRATITVTGIWEGRSVSGEVLATAFYAPIPKRTAAQEESLGRIEPLTDTYGHMMRHTIATYEVYPDSRVAIFHLMTLQRTLAQALEQISRTVSRLVQEQVLKPDLAIESSDLSWISRSIDLCQSGKKEESLDVIFDALDEMLLESRFHECDAALLKIPVNSLSNAQLLTVLTATLPAKERLSNRNGLVTRIKSQLERRGADVSRLLVGLE